MAKANSYGLKEVADVCLYAVNSSVYPVAIGTDGTISWTGTETAPSALYTFDSLKVSTLELTAEETAAKGGKGNPDLIVWQYGKELTLTCEDALISMDTLKLMMGGEDESNILTVFADKFNIDYAITGKTTMRSYNGGSAEFLFFIPKGHLNVGSTLTMQADGDPSTFEMSIKALAYECGSEKNVLIKYIKSTDHN